MTDRKLFVYDLDDTLFDNHHDYSRAQLRFVEWMIDTLGRVAPDAQSILNLQVDIDHEAAERLGFGKDRFPASLVETYRRVCDMRKVRPNEAHERQAQDIGASVFDERGYRRKGLLPGAEAVLDFHVAQGDDLILLTKGDPDVQDAKIRALKLRDWFGEATHVVLRKSADDLRRVINGHDPARTWHVGNSIRSDIEPALAIGIGAVYCPCETWQFERVHAGMPEHPRLVTIERIDQIIDRYHALP